jgi:hypothetical protein
MSALLPPTVRYMILCDEALHDPKRPGRLTITGLIPFLRWPAQSMVPLRLERLVVLLILADGRGTGRGQIVCFNDETGVPVSRSGEAVVSFADKDPSIPIGRTFTMRDCYFPAPGAYIVRFLLDDEPICDQPLTVR